MNVPLLSSFTHVSNWPPEADPPMLPALLLPLLRAETGPVNVLGD